MFLKNRIKKTARRNEIEANFFRKAGFPKNFSIRLHVHSAESGFLCSERSSERLLLPEVTTLFVIFPIRYKDARPTAGRHAWIRALKARP